MRVPGDSAISAGGHYIERTRLTFEPPSEGRRDPATDARAPPTAYCESGNAKT